MGKYVAKWKNLLSLHPKRLIFKTMLSFWGNISAKLDNKGRVAIPVQFRKILQTAGHTSVMLKKDIFHNCLTLYTLDEWDKKVAQLRGKINQWNKKHLELFRQYVMDVEQLDIDTAGRILIPKRYLQLTNISTDVRFVGSDLSIEIWAKEELEKQRIPAEQFNQEIQELMAE